MHEWYKEKQINHLMLFYGFTKEKSEHYIDDAIAKGKMTIDGDLICYDPIMEIDLDGYSHNDLHGYSLKESLPKVCCFSGKVDNILMWSHYADSIKEYAFVLDLQKIGKIESWVNII